MRFKNRFSNYLAQGLSRIIKTASTQRARI